MGLRMSLDATKIRLGDLKRKLKARQGRKEFRENVAALETEIARLEAGIAEHEARA